MYARDNNKPTMGSGDDDLYREREREREREVMEPYGGREEVSGVGDVSGVAITDSLPRCKDPIRSDN